MNLKTIPAPAPALAEPSLMQPCLVGGMVIFSLPILTFWFAGGRLISSTLALWAGVMVSLVTIWVATPQLRQDSNMWPIDLVLLAFSSGIRLLVGALVFVMIQKASRLLLNR